MASRLSRAAVARERGRLPRCSCRPSSCLRRWPRRNAGASARGSCRWRPRRSTTRASIDRRESPAADAPVPSANESSTANGRRWPGYHLCTQAARGRKDAVEAGEVRVRRRNQGHELVEQLDAGHHQLPAAVLERAFHVDTRERVEHRCWYAKRPSSGSSLRRDDPTAPRAPEAHSRHRPRRSLAITRVAACNESSR